MLFRSGGSHSNNTRQLAQRCVELGCKSIQVESAKDLNMDWFAGMDAVGLTAGTSTPDTTIEEVAQYLEGAVFPIPKSLKVNTICVTP